MFAIIPDLHPNPHHQALPDLNRVVTIHDDRRLSGNDPQFLIHMHPTISSTIDSYSYE